MDRADIEGDAIALYRLAGLEPDEPVAISRLVRALLGTPIQVASFVRGKAHLSWYLDQWWIYVRAGIAAPRLRFDIGHELAHWWYRRCGYSGEDIELRCDALGAALVAPMPLFSAVRKRTSRIVQIAHATHLSLPFAKHLPSRRTESPLRAAPTLDPLRASRPGR